MNRYVVYFFFSVLNIIFFSLISLSIYRFMCTVELDYLKLFDSFLFTHPFYYSTIFTANFNCIFINIDYHEGNSAFLYLIPYCFFNSQQIYIYELFSNAITDSVSINNEYFFKIMFFTKVTFLLDTKSLEFFCLQDYIYCLPNETTLVFFRIVNTTSFVFECITIYLVYPYQYSMLLSKLQCFCFSNLILNSTELYDLPVLFFMSADMETVYIYKIYFFYILLLR